MLSRAEIARRIPHQGSMCLLQRVLRWDAVHIHCEADGHRAPDHPLRAFGRLGIACGIEYAAQAMAVHGALIGAAAGAPDDVPRAGYLASVRRVLLHAVRLDDVAGDLGVHAERVLGEGNHIVYRFRIEGQGRPLIEGQATVVLDAALADAVLANRTLADGTPTWRLGAGA